MEIQWDLHENSMEYRTNYWMKLDVPWSNCIDLLKNAEDIHGDDGMYIYIYIMEHIINY